MTDELMGDLISHVFAEPEANHFIDAVRPGTDRSVCSDETLAQIRARYPRAELMLFAEWRSATAARQHTPIAWLPSTRETYYGLLAAGRPVVSSNGTYLAGEPKDYDALTGAARYEAHRQIGDRYYTASRPMTRGELRRLLMKE